jgi:hypothetical protein
MGAISQKVPPLTNAATWERTCPIDAALATGFEWATTRRNNRLIVF